MSTLRLSSGCHSPLEAQGGGSITNIVSTSVKQPIPDLILSNTVRTAVVGLAKSLSNELASRNIRVNSVCPGIDDDRSNSFAGGQRAEKTGRSVDEMLEEDAKAIPIGQNRQSTRVRKRSGFLASPAASYITGVTLQVDGGIVKGLIVGGRAMEDAVAEFGPQLSELRQASGWSQVKLAQTLDSIQARSLAVRGRFARSGTRHRARRSRMRSYCRSSIGSDCWRQPDFAPRRWDDPMLAELAQLCE